MAKGEMKKKPAYYHGDRSCQAIRRYWRLKMLLNKSIKSSGKAKSRLRNAVARKAELNELLESVVISGKFCPLICNLLKEKLEILNRSFGTLEADLNRCEARVAGWKSDLNSCIQELLGLKSVLVITNFDYTAFMEMREKHGYAGKMVVAPTKRSEGFRKKLDKDRIPYAMADGINPTICWTEEETWLRREDGGCNYQKERGIQEEAGQGWNSLRNG